MLLGFKYGPEVDWWALGIVMYEMMVGQHPFHLPKRCPYREKILQSPVAYPLTLTGSAVSILNGVSIFNIKTDASGVPYSFLNSVFFHT
jgi:serine/threonine protein kinase